MSAPLARLAGKVALVAGGAGGIGSAIAAGLAANGAAVAIADRDKDAAERVVQGIESLGGRSLSIAVDVTDEADVHQMAVGTERDLGALDIFVNCVGMNIFSDLFDLSLDQWNQTLAINLTGVFLADRAVARVMASRGSGCIINFASVTAVRGSPGQAGYAAAKAGVVNLTSSMALEWMQHGIRVNGVSPIMTETPINKAWLTDDPNRRERIASRIPAGRLGQPDDFVGPVIFLASDDSSFVVGQTIFVDGGASITHPLIGA